MWKFILLILNMFPVTVKKVNRKPQKMSKRHVTHHNGRPHDVKLHAHMIADNFRSLSEVSNAIRKAGLESSNLIFGEYYS